MALLLKFIVLIFNVSLKEIDNLTQTMKYWNSSLNISMNILFDELTIIILKLVALGWL